MGREIIKQGSNMLLLDLKNRLKLNILNNPEGLNI